MGMAEIEGAMAKIYETKEDFERDKLKEQAGRLNNESLKQSGFGVSLIAISLMLDNWFSKTKHQTALLASTTVLSVVGAIEIVRSWFTHSKARSLNLERERMGQGTEVHLFNNAPQHGLNITINDEKDCYDKPKYAQNIQPTSLLEQAAKSDFMINHK